METLEVTLLELPIGEKGTIIEMPSYAEKACQRIRDIGGIQEGETTVKRLTDPFLCKGGPIRTVIGKTDIALCYWLAERIKVRYEKNE